MLCGRSLVFMIGISFSLSGEVFSQKNAAYNSSELTRRDTAEVEKTVESVGKDELERGLKAFRIRDQQGSISAGTLLRLIAAIVFGVLGLSMLLYFYYYEPSYRGSRNTEVGERKEGFIPYRRSARTDEEDW